MHSSCRSSSRPQVLCVQMCMIYSVVCLASWPLCSEAARLRCGSDLLSDLIFVCGDRGIYLGKGSWSGYGARPRGKGIVDKCCRPSGCDLQHLEMYCAKPKAQQHTTAYPTTSSTTTTTTTTTTEHTTKQMDVAQQFQAVFHKKLVEHLGGPNSQERNAYRRKTQPSVSGQRKRKSSNRRSSTVNSSSRPPTTSGSPTQGVTSKS